MDKILHDPKDPKLWNYGIFLIMGNAGFCPSTVSLGYRTLAAPSGWSLSLDVGVEGHAGLLSQQVRFRVKGGNPLRSNTSCEMLKLFFLSVSLVIID